jgi:hypothetical protein
MAITDWGESRDPAVQLELRTGDDAVAYFTAHRSSRDPIKFVYLNRAKTGDVFRPYDLEVVPREHVGPEHFTLSISGIVHVGTSSPSEFIPLEDWMKQTTLFNMLSSIKYFKHFHWCSSSLGSGARTCATSSTARSASRG